MRVCASCGRSNPADARFCNACGAVLGEESAREQRKVVSILRCDLVGSTALGEALDPESLRPILQRYYDAMKEIVERHGGTVEKFIGDAVAAVFGVPVVHEDDALRAVRAALEMRDALSSLEVRGRIGVMTGEVVTGAAEQLATGDAANVATRLEQAAGPGEILIGAATYALVRDAVDAELVAPIEAKGKAAPLTAYRLSGTRVQRRAHAESPLVGRIGELQLLRNGYERTVRERSCGLFTLLGVAGVGKSRLIREFLATTDEATVVRGHCPSYGEGITYLPVVEVVRELLDGADPDEPALAALLGDGATSPEETAWAVRKLFERRAEQRPLIVVFEDVHWAELLLLDLIEHVADLSRDASILLLCSGRPELFERRPDWGGGKLNATSLFLEPLTAAEVDLLIGQVDERLAARVRKAAAGNPLFVEEMLARALESPHDESLPPTIQALLAARLDQLPPDERALLAQAAVEGDLFHRDALGESAPAHPELDVLLASLVRKDLVRPQKETIPGDELYRFRHVLIRDAAYDGLPKAARADFHQAFVIWLDGKPREMAGLDELAGYHLEQAARYTQELGDPDLALATAAALRLGRAVSRAALLGDWVAGISLAQRALTLAPDDAGLYHVQALLPWWILHESRSEEAIATVDHSLERARLRGDEDTELLLQLIREQIVCIVEARPAERVRELAEQGLTRFKATNNQLGLLHVWWAISNMAELEMRNRDAAVAAERALAAARQLGLRDVEHDLVRNIATLMVFNDTPAELALRFIEENEPVFAVRQTAGLQRALLLAMLGRAEEARTDFERSARAIRERGNTAFWDTLWYLETILGNHDAAFTAISAELAVAQKLGRSFYSTAAVFLAHSLLELGRYAEAEPWVDTAEAAGAEDDVITLIFARAVRSRLLAQSGEHREAVQLARSAISLVQSTDAPIEYGLVSLHLAEVLLSARKQAEAIAVLDETATIFDAKQAWPLAERSRARRDEIVAARSGVRS